MEAFPWGSSVDEGGGSPLVEGGFPFSVETDEFEEEVQGGGNAKRLGKFQVAAAPESSKP